VARSEWLKIKPLLDQLQDRDGFVFDVISAAITDASSDFRMDNFIV